MKRFFFIMGLFSALALMPGAVHAQTDEDRCLGNVYENRYNCDRDSIRNFCDPVTPHSSLSLYTKAYCNTIRNDDEDIYEIVSEQLGMDDEDLVEQVLNGEKFDPDDLPDPLISRYGFDKKGAYERSLTSLSQDVRATYEKEKVLYHMRQSLEQEFEESEDWYDATLLNSSMDLVVDLNLIDTVLFGSQAEWNNDVFRFPREGDEEDEEEAPSSESASDNPEDSPAPPEDSEGSGTVDADSEEPDEFDPEEDCVPPTDPDAEPPSPGDPPLGCGNNSRDPGEDCDDGNLEAGDGCNNLCQLEEMGSLLCRDAESITFRNFEPSAVPLAPTTVSSSDEPFGEALDEEPEQCPPGTRPRRSSSPDSSLTPIPTVPQISQSPNYPGPYVGGVLREYAPSPQPPCPPGESELRVEYANPISGTSNPFFTPRCIPTRWCRDPNDTRDFLFDTILGLDWRNDPDVKPIAESITALFCVEVITANRPETPYNPNEGCIDCHIRAMNGTLEELLLQNVAPLENTRNAFALSNRWGPTWSLDLNTAVQSKTKLSDLAKVGPALKKAKEKVDALTKRKEAVKPTVLRQANVEELLNEYKAFEESKDQAYFEELKNYRINADAIKATQFAGRINPLLVQWHDSFKHLQDIYVGIADAIKWSETPLCEF